MCAWVGNINLDGDFQFSARLKPDFVQQAHLSVQFKFDLLEV